MAQRYFALTTPGLEQVLRQELRKMRTKRHEVFVGGVEFDATRRGLYQVLTQARIASRVYARLDEFRARDGYELFRKSKRLEWERWLLPGSPVRFDATTRRSKLRGTGEITDKILEGMQARFREQGEEPPFLDTKEVQALHEDALTGPMQGALRLVVRMRDNRCALSLDASGRPMHQRGWRKDTGAAPLRENIAAGLLALLGWEPTTPLIDPMCGAGTFLIEAARAGRGYPPRLWNEYACHNWINFDEALWQEVSQAEPPRSEAPCAPLRGSDQHPRMVELCARNALRAGVTEAIAWQQCDVSALEIDAEPAGMMIANPPYGERLSDDKAQHAHQELIARFAQLPAPWLLGLILPERITPQHPQLHAEALCTFRNGGIPVRFWRLQRK